MPRDFMQIRSHDAAMQYTASARHAWALASNGIVAGKTVATNPVQRNRISEVPEPYAIPHGSVVVAWRFFI